MVAAVLAIVSFLLILPLNALTKQLSVAAVIIAGTYPYFKRFFAIPQAYLGIAFGFGIPMASPPCRAQCRWWPGVLLLGNVFWAVAYDTEYAMVDRDDDLKIGIRTSAITFGRYDVAAVMLCYAVASGLDLACGWHAGAALVVRRRRGGGGRHRLLSLHADPRPRTGFLLLRLPPQQLAGCGGVRRRRARLRAAVTQWHSCTIEPPQNGKGHAVYTGYPPATST
jgi:hypothetical protein